ncbi:hypothetical protein H3C70_05175 [Patescibacteria group bacterium]|nr:hypothetical protein [Patescibacteria group bacterium]
MPFLALVLSILFFLVINLFLALFLASIVVLILKKNGVQVETIEMNFLVFLCCASVWIGIRVILLNFYTFQDFTTVFLWPMNKVMPKDIITFLRTSASL